ncbi:CAP domain-containing protein [uncultured Dysosmobacter sp.]|uniref:CAP domain-containing protein n=1 Tax=uncultured Dysosmobacter sp. TaxID=2591384 RepID=UPI00261E5A71|nr:CAP domain-containing protein [uncultured Dysosmobacter sp.]
MMKSRGKNIALVLTGMALGAALVSGAAAAGVAATPTWQPIYVDGRQVQMEAYNINGNNFVKLRDIGKEVGFNVYWQDGVRVDSAADYTGEPPVDAASELGTAAGDLEAVRQEMIQRINQVRRENGAGELAVNEALMEAAQVCADQGFRKHNFQYECETVLACGYPYGFNSNLAWFSGASKLNAIAQTTVSSWLFCRRNKKKTRRILSSGSFGLLRWMET